MNSSWTNSFIPPTQRTTDAMLRRLAETAEREAVRDQEGALTFAALNHSTACMACALKSEGISAGDVVAIDLPVGAGLLAAFLAVTRMGGRALLLYDLFKPDDVDFLIKTTQPKAVIGGAFHHTSLPLLLPHELEQDVFLRTAFVDPPAEDDIAYLRTTSGTTGRPKLIAVSHKQLCRRLPHPGLHYAPGRIYGCPSSHNLPCYQLISALGTGGTVVFRPSVTAGQIERFIAEERLTWFWGTPAMYELVARASGEPSDLSSLRAAVTSGAYLSVQTASLVERRWRAPLYQAYGQSELGYLTEAGPRTPPGSVGSPAPGVEFRIVDREGKALPPGMAGRIQARTDAPFAGYVTGEPSPVNEDGWFQTGDLGFLDETGSLFLEGRETDLIHVGGFKVSAQEIAGFLSGLPGVMDVRVFAEPHPLRGETVAAAIVAGEGLETADIRRHCRQYLPRYKQPAHIYLLDELPKNALGKVNHTALLAAIAKLKK